MKKLIFALAIILFISGCATKYQTTGFSGGYSETRLDENVFIVSFRGNGFTSRERASDFNLLRSAELSLEHGFNYFIITNSEKYTSYSKYTSATHSTTNFNGQTTGNNFSGTANTTTTGGETYNIAKPSTSNTIVCFKEKPNFNGIVYNAKYISKSIKDKYDIK